MLRASHEIQFDYKRMCLDLLFCMDNEYMHHLSTKSEILLVFSYEHSVSSRINVKEVAPFLYGLWLDGRSKVILFLYRSVVYFIDCIR